MRSVIVTGAGTGIGAATAKLFSKNGYHAFLLGRRKEYLENVAKECSHSSVIPCDLTKAEDVNNAVSQILLNKKLSIEVLVQNAGIFERHSFAEGSDELWRNQFETNLFGAVRLTRAIWPYFAEKRKGSVVMVSSTLGMKPAGGMTAYCATKAAMISLTQSLAIEGGPLGIRVNCVAPGIVDTPIHSFHSMDSLEKETTLAQMSSLQPLGRIGTSEEIATSIFFLGSDQSSWTTGSTLAVDGGINLA
ncbi:MAG: SDR family NAD(P)-dependent oxidoreductase [Pseudobdellovibrionaceae bacterium]